MSPYCRVSLRQQITDDFKMWKKRWQQQIKQQQNKTPRPSVSITDLLNLYMYANIYICEFKILLVYPLLINSANVQHEGSSTAIHPFFNKNPYFFVHSFSDQNLTL